MLLFFIFLISQSITANVTHYFASPPFLRQRNDGLDLWDFGGTSSVSEKFIQLTANAPNLKGSIWTKEKLSLNEWEANFQMLGCIFFFFSIL